MKLKMVFLFILTTLSFSAQAGRAGAIAVTAGSIGFGAGIAVGATFNKNTPSAPSNSPTTTSAFGQINTPLRSSAVQTSVCFGTSFPKELREEQRVYFYTFKSLESDSSEGQLAPGVTYRIQSQTLSYLPQDTAHNFPVVRVKLVESHQEVYLYYYDVRAAGLAGECKFQN